MSCNIPPVYTQLIRARPIVQKLISTRIGKKYEASNIIENNTNLLELTENIYEEYIPTTEHTIYFPFTSSITDADHEYISNKFPILSKYLKNEKGELTVSEYHELYKICNTRRILVDFSQCIEDNPIYVWMPTQRDNRFQLEMKNLIESIKNDAIRHIQNYSESIQKTIPEDMVEECIKAFNTQYCKIYLFITRNTKASETLHEKYDKMCNDIQNSCGLHVQLFNLKCLMFDVTSHVLVPHHKKLESDFHSSTIDFIMKKYNISQKEDFPLISHYDPIARFIGLKENDICQITRRNQTCGDFVYYRRCVHETR